MKQQQFLNLASAEDAEERFWQAVQPGPLGEELIPLADARERILSRNVIAKHNVPYFDRSNFDGFAVRAEDTFGAQETAPGFPEIESGSPGLRSCSEKFSNSGYCDNHCYWRSYAAWCRRCGDD